MYLVEHKCLVSIFILIRGGARRKPGSRTLFAKDPLIILTLTTNAIAVVVVIILGAGVIGPVQSSPAVKRHLS